MIKPNRVLSHTLILQLIKFIEAKTSSDSHDEEAHSWFVFLVYVTITYVLTLRGAEGFLLDLKGLIKYWKKGANKYTIIPLTGKFKGEHEDGEHLIPFVNETKSGIKVRSTLRHLIKQKHDLGFRDGPAISNHKGKLLTARELDKMLVESLSHIYNHDPSIFPGDFHSADDIAHSYQCFRAIEVKIAKTDMETVNRWRSVETAAGKRPNLPMHIHYAQVEELLGPFLRFTGAM